MQIQEPEVVTYEAAELGARLVFAQIINPSRGT